MVHAYRRPDAAVIVSPQAWPAGILPGGKKEKCRRKSLKTLENYFSGGL